VLTSPPYTLAGTEFPYRALAALAGRAPLGGAREAALATLLAARLAEAMLPPSALGLATRRARADGARHWLTSIALSNPIRAAISRLVDATATDDPHGAAMALIRVTEITAPHLDRGARLELERLADRLKG
jgi:hypothetical protein